MDGQRRSLTFIRALVHFPSSSYSVDLRGLIQKMLALNPDDRPTIDAVLDHLEVLNPA